jgi:hypothetical protein
MSWLVKFFEVVVAAAATVFVEKIPEFYKNIKSWWTGKTIAIIGATASGKNSMYSRLRKEEIPAEHIQTRGAETFTDFPIRWPLPNGDLIDFKCKRSINIGGEIDERERYWLQACEGADVIFYLIDTEKLLKDQATTLKRFHDDMCWLVTNFRHFKPSVTVHLLLNKIDITLGRSPHTDSALNSMKKLVDTVEREAKDTLAEYFQRVTGVTPISMSDEHLFGKYFASALSTISELSQK